MEKQCGVDVVQWDAAPLLDLLFKDAKKTECGDYVKRISKRITAYHSKLGSGFGKASLTAIESEIDEKVKFVN